MAHFIWDFGFDFKAAQQLDGTFYLQNGFVLIAADVVPASKPGKFVVNAPATPVELLVGDEVSFNVFNVTDNPPPGEYSILGGSMTFTPAEEVQTNSSPFAGSSVIPFPGAG